MPATSSYEYMTDRHVSEQTDARHVIIRAHECPPRRHRSGEIPATPSSTFFTHMYCNKHNHVTWRALFCLALLEGSQSADFPVYGALIPGRGGTSIVWGGGVLPRGVCFLPRGGDGHASWGGHATWGRFFTLGGEVRHNEDQF